MYLLGTPNLDRLNLQNLPGVGLETEKKLNKHGIHKVNEKATFFFLNHFMIKEYFIFGMFSCNLLKLNLL